MADQFVSCGRKTNSASASTNFLISHGQAIRSTIALSRVIHFMCSLFQPPFSLDAGVPLVALILPVAAGSIGQEINFGQVFHVLVAELDGRVEAERRAV